MRFIRNASGSALINLSHVVFIGIQTPRLEQTEYAVTAYFDSHGSQVLHRGSKESCEKFCLQFEEDVNN